MVIYIYIYVYFVWYSIHNKCRYLSLLHVDSYFIKLSVKTGCDPTFGHERNRIKIIIIIIKKGLHVKTALEHFKNLQRAPNISETSLTTWLLLSGRGTQVHPELRWCKAAYSFNSSVETHTHAWASILEVEYYPSTVWVTVYTPSLCFFFFCFFYHCYFFLREEINMLASLRARTACCLSIWWCVRHKIQLKKKNKNLERY